MATPFETFVNGELPKRVSTEDSPISWTNGQVLTTTGVGLGVEAVDANTLGFEPSITGSGVATEFLNGNKVFTSVTATSIGAIPTSEKGAADGVATLDTDGKIPLSQIPAAAVERVVIVADETARFALTTATVQQGDVVDQQTPKAIYFVVDDAELDNAAGYSELVAGTAAAVAWSGVTGIPVIISDIAAVSGSVDGDVLQRVAGTWVNRTAAQLKTSLAIETSDVSGLSTALGLKADLASPTFTGTVTVPTATAGDSSTAAASTAFVAGEISTNAQPKDATLTALAAYNTNGIVVQTAADTFAGRSLAAGQGITILNPSAVAANPTISITDTAVTPGTYGSASKIPIFVVDSMGRTTDASEVDNGIFSDSVFRIQDNLAPTKQMAYELSSITAGQTRTITMPDRDVTVGSLPPFAASTHYGQRATIQEAGLMYSAKLDFTSGATFDLADWDAIGSLGLKVKVLGYGTSPETLEAGYEYINPNGTNLSSVVYEMPDPEFVPDGSRIVIHNLTFDGSTSLGTSNWTPGGPSRFMEFPNYSSATTSPIPAYSRGVITTLTSVKAYKLWMKESHRPSKMLPTGNSMRFYREDDITATITNYLGNIPAATNRVITYPNSDVDLGKLTTTPTYTASTGVLAFPKLDGTAATSLSMGNVSDSAFRIQDNGDSTKQLAFEVSGVATATTRTWTVPNADINFGTMRRREIVSSAGAYTLPTSELVGMLTTIELNASPISMDIGGMQSSLDIICLVDGSTSLIAILQIITNWVGTPITTLTYKRGDHFQFVRQNSSDIHVFKRGSVSDANFTIRKDGTNYGFSTSIPSLTASRILTLPDFDINLGKASFIATTNSNTLGGTDCRIEGGNNNNVSGTNSSTYMCQYQTVTGTDNRAISSRPTTGTGIFTHAGNGNTYYNHRHTGATSAITTTNCTFYDCNGAVGNSSDVNVTYRAAGNGAGATLGGFVPHTQVLGGGFGGIPLRATCMLSSAATATNVAVELLSMVAGATVTKPPLARSGGIFTTHLVTLHAYDINGFASPRYAIMLQRKVDVFYDSSIPSFTVSTVGTDSNPSNLTYTVAFSNSSGRLTITATATDPTSPVAPGFPLTYKWYAVVESTYF